MECQVVEKDSHNKKHQPGYCRQAAKRLRSVSLGRRSETMPREKFLEDTKDAHAVLTMLSDKVDEEFLSNAPEMKVVANLAVGFDNIDLDAAERHEVVITNTPDVLTETTAELAFTLMLVSARK